MATKKPAFANAVSTIVQDDEILHIVIRNAKQEMLYQPPQAIPTADLLTVRTRDVVMLNTDGMFE